MKGGSLLWYFDKDLHSYDDKKYKFLKVPEKVAILNRAIDIFYDKIFQYRDKNPLFDKWLSPYKVDGAELEFEKAMDTYNLYKFPEKYQITTYAYIHAEKEGCSAVFDATPIMASSSMSALNNEMWKPDFDFEQTFRTIDGDGIKIYHQNQFKITKAIISYIRRHDEIHVPEKDEKGQYVYHDGNNITKNVDLKFGEGAYDPIVNIAVLMATDNSQDFNLTVNKILNIKSLQYEQ